MCQEFGPEFTRESVRSRFDSVTMTGEYIKLSTEKVCTVLLYYNSKLCQFDMSRAFSGVNNKHCEVLVSCSDWVDWINFIELHVFDMLSKAVISTAWQL